MGDLRSKAAATAIAASTLACDLTPGGFGRSTIFIGTSIFFGGAIVSPIFITGGMEPRAGKSMDMIVGAVFGVAAVGTATYISSPEVLAGLTFAEGTLSALAILHKCSMKIGEIAEKIIERHSGNDIDQP